jgi:hypothetical protein
MQISLSTEYYSFQGKNVTELGFLTGPSVNLSETLPRISNQDENDDRWQ